MLRFGWKSVGNRWAFPSFINRLLFLSFTAPLQMSIVFQWIKIQYHGLARIAITHTTNCWIVPLKSCVTNIRIWRPERNRNSSCDHHKWWELVRKRRRLRISQKSAECCIVNRNIYSIFCWLSWVPAVLWMVIVSWLLRGGSSRNRLKMCWEGINYCRTKKKLVDFWVCFHRYIKEYVTCHTCRSPDTILQKDTRLFFLQCEACGSRCSVASIKSGFQVSFHRKI